MKSNTTDFTVRSFISTWARSSPETIAITAPDRSPLTYGRLGVHVGNMVDVLNSLGIGRNDRVATVLPNGPDMAAAFLAIASGATCAPLNPDYREQEFDFFLSDLNAKALVIQSGMDSPALNVAQKRGMSTIYLSPISEAGMFSLVPKERAPTKHFTRGFAQPDDIALVLHTSGTTSRPKIVPLTQINICASANNIRESLKLTQNDCCLNIMPLFHIHGLIGATLSTISAGARIICTPGFLAPKFFEWLKIYQPTWYTAVPTMHQAILTRSEENKEAITRSKLRLVRSSSSTLPPQVMAKLEGTFNVPVIEAYGMTEASHQIASNPLPPLKRKPGSVGIATGPEVAIMDDEGRLLTKGETGEIVIRGPTIVKAYENNLEANSKAFTNGWFRTGDRGHFDEDNYLVIKDRIKEIINRGGEKISPREIDEVILNHPSVLQAVTFAFPHSKLGEDIAVAVVLRDKSAATEWEIQKFVASRLAEFKVPSRVIILDAIPKGPTGKIQRIGLAEKLGLALFIEVEPDSRPEYRAPSTPLEEELVRIWSEVLKLDRVGVNDNFFQLGGDSIQAGLIISKISRTLQVERIPLAIFLHAPTIRRMAEVLNKKELDLPPASLTALQQVGSKPPFYCVHACEGEVLFLTSFAKYLGPEHPFYALRAQGLDGHTPSYTRVEDMATHYLKEIQAIQPKGPYLLGGAGVGGIVAWEMAQRLKQQSKEVSILVLMDSILPKAVSPQEYVGLEYFLHRIRFHIENGNVLRIVKERKRARIRRIKTDPNALRVLSLTQKAADSYIPAAYDGRVLLFMSEKRFGFPRDPKARIDPWHKYAIGRFDKHVVPGEHMYIFKEPNVQVLARMLRKYLDEILEKKI